ncbi:MAG: hypothetical protein KGP28_06210 [Bdellovibrionales bacterium]|nr:hypothetical protein [Bdellovibrionales bacterium]
MNLHFLFLMSTLMATKAGATSFFIRPFPEFIREAENIVRGRIHQPHSEFGISLGGERNVHTYAELEVLEVLKGAISKTSLQIRKLGGTKDGITLQIPGSPEFRDGEESVLFLGPENEDHSYEVTGLELGKFGLVEKNGDLELTGGLFSFSTGPESQEAIGPGVVENRRVWTLKQLKELVETQKMTAPEPRTGSSSPEKKSPNPSLPAQEGRPPPANVNPIHETSGQENHERNKDNPETVKFAGVLFIIAGAFLGILLYLRRK